MQQQSTTPNFLCNNCGTPFYRPPSARPGPRAFCGMACYQAQRILPTEERFWARVGRDDTADACWIWQGQPRPNGYGYIRLSGSDPHVGAVGAHCFAWELATGQPPPQGWCVLHTCDNRRCVRNDEQGTYTVNGVVRLRWGHLFLGTREDNIRDAYAKGRAIAPSLRYPERVRRGERVHRAILTDATAREIRERAATGTETQAAIARALGVTPSVVNYVVKRRTWKHV